MKNSIKKLGAILALGFISTSAMSATSTALVNVSGEILPGCITLDNKSVVDKKEKFTTIKTTFKSLCTIGTEYVMNVPEEKNGEVKTTYESVSLSSNERNHTITQTFKNDYLVNNEYSLKIVVKY